MNSDYYLVFFTRAFDVEYQAYLSKGLPNTTTNTTLSSHDSLYCLGYTLPDSVAVFVLCGASAVPVCCRLRFLSFQDFSVGLMSEPTAICLWLYHETYFAEMFTPRTYNN